MEIIKNKKGICYRVRVYTGPKTVSRTFRTKREAMNWQAKMRLDRKSIYDCDSDNQLCPQKYLSEAAEEWYSSKAEVFLSRKTKVSYRGSISKYLTPWLGDTQIGMVQAAHAESLIKLLIESKLHAKTVNRHLCVFKQIMRFSFERGWIAKNPLATVRQLPLPDSVFTYLTREEINALLVSNRGDPIYSVLMIALNTGMRLGEVCGLCWDQVSFQSRQLAVRRTMSVYGLLETTKTRRIRYVPINDELMAYLAQLHRQHSSKFVCVTEHGTAWNVDHMSERGFAKALRRAELRKVRFHDLRHTYASHFVMNGGSIYDLQKILGHTRGEMTMRYAHLSPDHLVNASNVVSFNGLQTATCHKPAMKNLKT
ncbi:MAG: site-specific integrase [Bdellovibrionaceae bacterium]|nr:site-specific integrase [Pseudobdellovibrionaceae bacterium]